MATSGTNNTVKWTLSNGVLTISPKSGNSGIARKAWGFDRTLTQWITLTADEISAVQTIIFTGDIQFYTNGYSGYSKETNLAAFMAVFSNTSEIDVSGLNTAGVKNFAMFFPESLMNLTGLSSMDVASGNDFYRMFEGTKLESLDLSTFPLNSADEISDMLDRMSYCHTVKLPSNFSRKYAYVDSDSGQPKYYFGLASSRIPATKDGVTVTSDEDFFKLDSAQGGTWTRDISGSATLSFQVKSTSREANIATINYKYATSSATVNIYLKKASESSFPSTSSKTVTISGTGSGSVEIELATDDAYDIKMVASDGNTSIYAYPSVSSNILLFEVDEEGNINVSRDLRTKGDLYTEGDADVSGNLRASGDVSTEGNIDVSGGITTGGDVHAEGNTGYFGDIRSVSSVRPDKSILYNRTVVYDCKNYFVPDSSSMVVKNAYVALCGRICQLTIVFTNTGSVASGGNFISGKFTGGAGTFENKTAPPLPRYTANGATYYGKTSISGSFGMSSGTLTIRNASPAALTIGSSNSANMSFTYIVEDGFWTP